MPVFRGLYKISLVFALVVIGYMAGSLLWSAGTGFIAGILDVVGVHTPAAPVLAISPIAGIVGAAGLVGWRVS